jgi:hypothetical protein
MQHNELCKARTKKFFDKVRTFFTKAFDGVQHFIENNIEPAIQFTKAIKAAVDSGAADIVADLIPGKWDDAVVAFLRANLGTVIDLLQIQLVCGKQTTLEDKIACYLDYLRTCSPDMRDALYAKTASLLTRLSSDKHQFTDAEIDAMVQLTYTQLKHD